MFLNHLKAENKESFLEVCVLAAQSNGIFAAQQKELITTYCREMNIPEKIPTPDETMENVLQLLANNTSAVEKK